MQAVFERRVIGIDALAGGRGWIVGLAHCGWEVGPVADQPSGVFGGQSPLFRCSSLVWVGGEIPD
jgi:hypothetical protein